VGWLKSKRVVGMRAEVAYAYDLASRTARELPDPPGETNPRWYADRELRKKYGILDSEWCGRIDLVCFGHDEHGSFLRIWDYKFHFGPEHEDATAQLEVCALAVARTYGLARVEAIAVHVWEDREVLEEPVGQEGPAGRLELSEFQLASIAADVADFARGPANDPQPNGGAHCKARHCPARVACPLTAQAVQGALAAAPPEKLTPGVATAFTKDPETNDEGADALVAIDLLEQALAAKKASVKALADRLNGIRLSNGKEYSGGAPQVSETPNLDHPGAVELLRELHADFAIKTSTTWSALDEALGAEGAKLAREKLTAIGAVKASAPFHKYMARKVVAGAKALAAKRAS
jgi:hypothetical protein